MAVGLKDICALIAAAGIGAGGVVAVQEVAAPKAPAARKAAKPVVRGNRTLRTIAPATPIIFDCPLPSASLGGLGDFSTNAGGFHGFQPVGYFAPYPDGWIGGGGGLRPPFPPSPPTLPAVPEPGAWAMMIAGFGLIGASARWFSSKESKV